MALSEPLVRDLGEFDLIDLLASDFGRDPGVIVGIGDDAAAFELPAGHVAVTTCDSQIEDVHFKKDRIEPKDIGWRAVAVNLSDLAAMGAEPNFILVSLALPANLEVSWIRSVYAGIAEINGEFATSIIGGNISRTAGPIVIDVTAIGSCRRSDLILRSGARAGDCVVVTGEPGCVRTWPCTRRLARDRTDSSARSILERAPQAQAAMQRGPDGCWHRVGTRDD